MPGPLAHGVSAGNANWLDFRSATSAPARTAPRGPAGARKLTFPVQIAAPGPLSRGQVDERPSRGVDRPADLAPGPPSRRARR